MRWIIFSLFVIILSLAIFIPFISKNPDGLERTMEILGLNEVSIYSSPLNYGDSYLTTLGAGAIGIFCAFILVIGIAFLLKKFGNKDDGI